MAESIIRHFKRILLPAVHNAKVIWPQKKLTPEIGEIKVAFSGDTLHLFALFEERPEGEVTIELDFGETVWQQSISLKSFDTYVTAESSNFLASLAASRRLNLLSSDQDQIELGVTYQLQSSLTNYLVLAERNDLD